MELYLEAIPTITIIIPCFNQPKLLNRCLNSIKNQSYKGYKVILIDDCSTVSYEEVLDENSDISYSRQINSLNLGSMQNMSNCIKLPVSTEYKIVFHEDDLMHPFLLESLLYVMDKNPQLIATGTRMTFFRDNYVFTTEDFKRPDLTFTTYSKSADLVFDFIKGLSLCFGSIAYRSDYLSQVGYLDLKRYWSLSDRPFIINLLSNYQVAVIDNPLVFYNEHYKGDSRSINLRANHVLNFFKFYSDHLGPTLDGRDRNLFKSIVSKEMLISYWNLRKSSILGFTSFVISGLSRKILSLKYVIYHGIGSRWLY